MKKRAALGGTGLFSKPQPDSDALAGDPRYDRDGRKAMPFWTTAAASKQLKQLALDHDTTQQALMGQALNMLFKKLGMPPVA